MSLYNSFQRFPDREPMQSTPRSSSFHDLGNRNVLGLNSWQSPDTTAFSPTSYYDTGSSSDYPFVPPVSSYQEYHGTFPKSSMRSGSRKRRNSVSAIPSPQYSPTSFNAIPRSYTDPWTNDSRPAFRSSSYDMPAHERAQSVNYAMASPLLTQPYQSPNSMLYSPSDTFAQDYTYANERPLEFNHQVHRRRSSNFFSNVELHVYLSSPSFSYSLLNYPETIYRAGFMGLYDYATRPPTSRMDIKCPSLPWPIRVGSRDKTRYITVHDVLSAIYELLRESPTHSEINILYSSSEDKKKYRKIMDTYKKRSFQGNAYQKDYFRKIDWLCGENIFDGLIRKEDERETVWQLCLRQGMIGTNEQYD